MPERIECYNRVVVDGEEALCIFLRRFAYPCRYADMVPMFARPAPQLSMISNTMMDHVYAEYGHLLSTFNQL